MRNKIGRMESLALILSVSFWASTCDSMNLESGVGGMLNRAASASSYRTWIQMQRLEMRKRNLASMRRNGVRGESSFCKNLRVLSRRFERIRDQTCDDMVGWAIEESQCLCLCLLRDMVVIVERARAKTKLQKYSWTYPR